MLKAQNATEQRVAAHHTHVLEQLFLFRCPRCHDMLVDWDGCMAVVCTGCRAGFCGWCFADCGADAHAHVKAVPACTANLAPGGTITAEWHSSVQTLPATQLSLSSYFVCVLISFSAPNHMITSMMCVFACKCTHTCVVTPFVTLFLIACMSFFLLFIMVQATLRARS